MVMVGDPVVVAPDIYSVLLENDRVRVLDVRMRPGARSARHAHPDSVWYLITPMRARFTAQDGMTAEAEFPAGAVWRDGESHAVENIGANEMRGIAVELK
jgi:quercetin dioxygenase-like cupin family protein